VSYIIFASGDSTVKKMVFAKMRCSRSILIPIQKILATIIEVEFVYSNIVDGASPSLIFRLFGILSMATHPTNIVALICQIGIR